MSQNVLIHIETLTCSECGIEFGAPAFYFRKRRDDRKTFYCPNGHGQHFTGETEADTLRKQLQDTRRRLDFVRDLKAGEERRADPERRLAATRGVVTKMKKRVGAGVCPCCNRHFSALERHMASQHPEFVKDEEA